VLKRSRPTAKAKAEILKQYMPQGRESFSVGELAKIFDCSLQHIQNFIKDGALDAINPNARPSLRRVSRASLENFLISRIVVLKPPKQKRKS
jgi:hypothetical protein